MPCITQLKQVDRRSMRTTVYLDGEEWATIDSEVVLRNCLGRGQNLSEKEMDALLSEDAFVRGRRVAARLLAIRRRSVEELRTRLREYLPKPHSRRYATHKGSLDMAPSPGSVICPPRFSAETIGAVIDYFAEKGDLDDYQFACRFVRHQAGMRPLGKLKLRNILRAYGVEESIIERAIAHSTKGREEEAIASVEALIAKRLPRYQKEPPMKRRAKMENALLRAGFEPNTYRPILLKALATSNEE